MIRHITIISLMILSCSSINKEEQIIGKPIVIDKFISKDSNTVLIRDKNIFLDHWDSLPQVQFWKKIMALSPDSVLVNNSKTREIVYKMAESDYFSMEDSSKLSFKKNLITFNHLDSTTRLYVTTGKNHYYKFDRVVPSIKKSIPIFEENGVNPWYAQAILLIESPAALYKSPVGAYGSFQIMSRVARKYGLTVNKYTDERKDLEKSAGAAARLINEICIPYAKSILENHQLSYSEDDLYFKLLVLHIYHAGAGNVMKAVDQLAPTHGGMEFIQGLWQTETSRFKNASQNYSQVALAAMVILHECCIY